MGFDVENFGIGLVAGWVSAYIVYRLRRQISFAVGSARSQAASAQNYATRSADGRYINDLVALANSRHIAGDSLPLSDLLIEPRFLPVPDLVAPPSDDEIPSVFRVVPQVHDHPYLHAPYNIETLSIDDLASRDRALALLGLPGSGRSSALLAIALHSLGLVRFFKQDDLVQRNLDAEEAALSEEERKARAEARERIATLAREELKDKYGITFEFGESAEEPGEGVTRFNQFLPVYVHLGNVNVDPQEFGSSIDPAEPLVRAVQHQVGTITARTLPLNLYKRLNAGEALLLIDGLDSLSAAEQQQKRQWLRALMDTYPDNFFIVSSTPQGHGALVDLGLTPVYLRPFDDLDTETLVRRWASGWPRIGGSRRRPANRPNDESLARARTNNRAMTPAELSLKIWTILADDAEFTGPEGWLKAYLSRHLPESESLDTLLPQLANIAALQLDEGFITLARVEELVQAEAVATISDEDETEKKGRGKKQEDSSAHSRFLTMLRRSGLLIEYRGGRYQFRLSTVAAYLASLTLKEVESHTMAASRTLLDHLDQPAWSQAVAYAAMHTPFESAFRERMHHTPDVLHSAVLDMARWLAYAPRDAEWRGPLMKHLGNLLVAPNQYPILRERAAAALISTRDRNMSFIFRQAARNPNPDVRRLACLGIGALEADESYHDLIPLLEDQVDEVQLAAAMALAATGEDDALHSLVVSLTEGEEALRLVIAESLALNPKDGHPILFDAITHEDMMVRRAATFGLRRVGTPWAIDSLYRAFLEDSQWYVKSAAQQAFYELQQDAYRGPEAYPALWEVEWIARWSQEHGEKIPSGEGAYQVLANALQDGEPLIREMAARMTGQLGASHMAKNLYNALRDRQANVRAEAYRALGEIEMQTGQSLPSPN